MEIKATKADLSQYTAGPDGYDKATTIELLTRALELACVKEMTVTSMDDSGPIEEFQVKGAQLSPDEYLHMADIQLTEGIKLPYES